MNTEPKTVAQLCLDQPDPYAAAQLIAIYQGKLGFTKTMHFNDGSCLKFKITYTAMEVGRSEDQ